jgi:hypothetical protein
MAFLNCGRGGSQITIQSTFSTIQSAFSRIGLCPRRLMPTSTVISLFSEPT